MKTGTKRRGQGGKLNRSETVTIRLDPQLRYLAELGARQQRRTTSSFIEWAIEQALTNILVRGEDGEVATLRGQAATLWDIDDADRFVKLAQQYPEWLTHDEQIVWKRIKECGDLWETSFVNEAGLYGTALNMARVRQQWEALQRGPLAHTQR